MPSQTNSNNTAVEILFICDDAEDSDEIDFEPVVLDSSIWKKDNKKKININRKRLISLY